MDYEVLIVGGRAAGSSLALLLARQGHRVLVVDRDEFPSDTLSTHLMNPTAVGRLARLGVLADVEAAGFRRITRMRTWIDDCCFEGPAGPGGASFSLAPRRAVLDSVLIDHAVTAGAEFEQRTRAENLIVEDGRVAGAVLQRVHGDRRSVRAEVVVGADGRQSRVAQWVGAEKYLEVPALRPGYYGYFQGVEPLPEPAVEMWFGGDRIGFLFPMRRDEDCLALEVQPEEFESFRRNPQEAFEERFRALPGMERRTRGATLGGRILGTRGIDNFFRKPYGPGWALTGDAGYLKDPSTGTGLGDALAQSQMLAGSLHAWFAGADWDQTMSAFQQRRDAAMLPGYQATLAHTRMRDQGPEDVAWIKAVMCNPGLVRAFGHAMPGLLQHAFPDGAKAQVTAVARMFGAPEQEPEAVS
ncbi:MAG: NAD(P)/FAD-dependent oxidoreductase [bacterium]|jgi:flavin-dependent dehydrogenase|nr:NAD(P)/FAD-dependent oxidoreductase [bacterium]